jgi:predicted DNA-binding transcriptional regulator AlpA
MLSEQRKMSSLINNGTSKDIHEPERLLSDHDLERLTGRARSSWQKARIVGNGPPFIRLGRLVRYRRCDFEAWLNQHPKRQSTSEAVSAAIPHVAGSS